jgi:hypothetical protein
MAYTIEDVKEVRIKRAVRVVARVSLLMADGSELELAPETSEENAESLREAIEAAMRGA